MCKVRRRQLLPALLYLLHPCSRIRESFWVASAASLEPIPYFEPLYERIALLNLHHLCVLCDLCG